MNPWIFLPLSELLTLLLWLIATKLMSSKDSHITRYLLMDTNLQESGKVINFSLPANTEAICTACERISDFCEENGMNPKQYLKVSLSMEEMMMLIMQVNQSNDTPLSFDLRVFSLQEVIGIRIRYGGVFFNPIHSKTDSDSDLDFMGFKMIEKLVHEVLYRQTFGVNTILVLI